MTSYILAPNNHKYNNDYDYIKEYVINTDDTIYSPISVGYGDFVTQLLYINYLSRFFSKKLDVVFIVYNKHMQSSIGDTVEDKINFLKLYLQLNCDISFVYDDTVNTGIFNRIKQRFEFNVYRYMKKRNLSITDEIKSHNVLYTNYVQLPPIKYIDCSNKRIGVWKNYYSKKNINKYIDNKVLSQHYNHFIDCGYELIEMNYDMDIKTFIDNYTECGYIFTHRTGLSFMSKLISTKTMLLMTGDQDHKKFMKHIFHNNVNYIEDLYSNIEPSSLYFKRDL